MTDPALSGSGQDFKDGLRDKLEAAKLHRSDVLDKHMTISIRYALDATECEMESSARTLPRPAEGPVHSRGFRMNNSASAMRKFEPMDYHFSYYSLAHGDGGVCIDMTDGQVRFEWDYVPFGETPSKFATFARRLHFRSGHHVDEPTRQIRVPRRPLRAI